MRRYLLALSVLLATTTGLSALSSVSARKSYSAGELFTASDYNADRSETVGWVNNLIALHPGDSTKTVFGAHDTLVSRSIGQIITKHKIASLAAEDSLEFHIANIGRANVDSLYLGGTPIVGFVTGVSAGKRAFYSYANTDTFNTDSLTVGGPATFLPGATLTIHGIADMDTVRADSMTVAGDGTVTGAFSVGSTATFNGQVTQPAGAQTDLEYASVDTLSTDSLTVIGDATVSGAFSVGSTASVNGHLTQPAGQQTDLEYASVDTLNTDSLTVIGPATVSGTLTAGALAGDGSAITGLPTGTTLSTNISYPDCTKTTYSARKVICGSDYNPYWMWDLDLFRAEQADNSYVASDGYWPDEWCVTISEGQDTVAVWDRRTMTTPWQVYKVAGTTNDNRAAVGDAVGSVWRLDGKLYMGQPGGWGLTIADYRSDVIDLVYTTTIQRFKDDIAGRNNGVGVYAVTNIGTIDDDINAVSAIRDPFGLKDGDWPAQWWHVSTENHSSTFNPHANAIYDANIWSGDADENGSLLLPGGGWFAIGDGTSDDVAVYRRSIFSVTADGWQNNEAIYNGGSGSEDLAWPDAAVYSDIAAIEHGSIENAPYILLASDYGLYGMQTKPSVNTDGIKVRFHDDYQGPAEKGDTHGAWALYDTVDASVYGNDLTTVGSPGFLRGQVSIPFSNAYSSTVGSLMWATEVDGFTMGGSTSGNSVTLAFSAKSASATNPSGNQWIVYMPDNGTADSWGAYFDSDGHMNAFVDDAAQSSDIAAGATDLYDGAWHDYVMVADRDIGAVYLYVDGELHASDVSAASTNQVEADTAYVGATNLAAGFHFDGQLAMLTVQKSKWSAEDAKERHRAFVASMNAPLSDPTLPDSNVVAVATIPGGGNWVATADADSVKVWAKVGVHLIPHSVYPAPGAKIRDVAIWAMADSFGLAIADSTAFQVVQPDPKVADLAQHRRYPFVQPMVGAEVVVDSTGANGLFWHVEDAIDAGGNANVNSVHIMPGTYLPFDVTVDYMNIRGSGSNWTDHTRPYTLIDGGTTDHAIDLSTGQAATIRDLVVRTTPGGGQQNNGIHIQANGYLTQIDNISVYGCDNQGIFIAENGNYVQVRNSKFYDTDVYGIYTNGFANNFLGNVFYGTGSYSMYLDGLADNSLVVGNTVKDPTNGPLLIDTNCENVLYNANRFDGAPTDNSGTGQATSNNSTAF